MPVGYEELAVAERKGTAGDWSQSEKAKKLRMNNNDNDDDNNKIIIVIIIITLFFFLGCPFTPIDPRCYL